MDSALQRLNAIPGKRDLSMQQAADVLDVSERSIRRLTKPDARGITSLGCRITGHMRKTERYKKYGHGHKVLIPRVDVVIYLARHHTRLSDFMASLQAQCPEYAPAVQVALAGGPGVHSAAADEPQAAPEAKPARAHPKRAANILSFDPRQDLFPELAPAKQAVA